MIGRLRGVLDYKSPQEVLIDVGGVGYRTLIPLTTFYRLGDVGSTVTLLVHTHVREDALQLFGFLTPLEKTMFERLIEVSGIGPRLALGILSGIEVTELTDALRSADLARLTRIPGVGRKTAERLVLELKDKLPREASAAQSVRPDEVVRHDLALALGHLGYSPTEADRAAERVLRDHPGARLEDALRRALQLLSSR
jgi:Holliday junction DNA helicase RuvA